MKLRNNTRGCCCVLAHTTSKASEFHFKYNALPPGNNETGNKRKQRSSTSPRCCVSWSATRREQPAAKAKYSRGLHQLIFPMAHTACLSAAALAFWSGPHHPQFPSKAPGRDVPVVDDGPSRADCVCLSLASEL